MKRSILFAVVIVLFVTTFSAAQDGKQDSAGIGNLILKVTGFENNDGHVRIALFNSEENYSERGEFFRGEVAEIKNLTAEWIFADLPFGEYAIKLYHDENDNGKLDSNILGIPSEAYGFSNNAPARFGPADYEDAKFIFSSANQTMEINLD